MADIVNGHGTVAKKKRKKKKKNSGGNSNKNEDVTKSMGVEELTQRGGTSVSVDVVMRKIKALGLYSIEEIETCVENMFSMGLAYDSYDDVIEQLQVLKGNNSNGRSESESIMKPIETKNTKENGFHTDNSKSSQIQVRNQSQNQQRKLETEGSQNISASAYSENRSIAETLQSLLENGNSIDFVLDGVIMWLSQSSEAALKELISSNALYLLFENMLNDVCTSQEFSEARMRSLERRLTDLLKKVLNVKPTEKANSSIVESVASLRQSILRLRDISIELDGVKGSENWTASMFRLSIKDTANLLVSVFNGTIDSNNSLNKPVENIGDASLAELTLEVDTLDRDIAPTAPRGDSILLNKTGNLSAGDVKRLFRLRDKSNRVVACASACCTILEKESKNIMAAANANIVNGNDNPDTPSAYMDESLEEVTNKVQEAMKKTSEDSVAARKQFEQLRNEKPQLIQPLQAQIMTLENETAKLAEQKSILMQQLEQVNATLAQKESAIEVIKHKLGEMETQYEAKDADLKNKMDKKARMVHLAEMQKAAVDQLARFSHNLKRASYGLGLEIDGEDALASSFIMKRNQLNGWRDRMILSVERYLGIEVLCINFMLDRIQKGKAELAHLQAQSRTGFSIPTLMNQLNDMIAKLERNCAEDNGTVLHLLNQARDSMKKVSIIIQERVKSNDAIQQNVVAAMWRIRDHCKSIGVEDIIRESILPRNAQQLRDEHAMLAGTATAKPSQSVTKNMKPGANTTNGASTASAPTPAQAVSSTRTWGGWGKSTPAATENDKKSLLEIQAEEEKLKLKRNNQKSEDYESNKVIEKEAEDEKDIEEEEEEEEVYKNQSSGDVEAEDGEIVENEVEEGEIVETKPSVLDSKDVYVDPVIVEDTVNEKVTTKTLNSLGTLNAGKQNQENDRAPFNTIGVSVGEGSGVNDREITSDELD
uniref:Uncharacterized protein n=1 Tax=Aplanochytrium stocchinoi TaxID=215587 RepID=A0A6S8DSU6_9STRA|mmetsp:Transcript_3253/g.4370  ORF Transcript_3253/g.4370 Transcript_3253/m.4370 type:complete len:940 (-) Transcript_3253:680-3499(-)